MAETTITGLPNATTPLSGTERVPMDQSGVTSDATTQAIADLAGTAITAAVAAHVAAGDPHPVYLTQTEGDARYAATGATGTTNLAYTPATRLLESSTGTDVTLPLVTSGDAGLAPASGGGTSNFLRADGSWAAPPGGPGPTDLSYTASTRLLESSTGTDVTLPLADGTNAGLMAAADKSKLDGIASGAEVNVNADWNAVSGDAQILNKPTLGTAAAAAATDFAPAAQGVTNGNSHDHSGGDGAQIAYSSLSGLPTLGTAAAAATGDFAPAAKGVTNGDSHDHNGGDGAQIAYSSLSGRPTLGTAAAAATTDFAAASHNQAWSTITSTPTTRSGYGITDAAANGAVGSSGLTMSTARLLGRSTASTGAIEEITLGSNLSFSGTTLIAAGGSPGGSNTQVQFNSSGSFAGDADLTFDGDRLTAKWVTASGNNAASTPAFSLTGTWFTGGTTTTTKPALLIEPAGTTSTGWSTAGTALGINAPSGFTGRYLDFQINGTNRFYIRRGGSDSTVEMGQQDNHIWWNGSTSMQISIGTGGSATHTFLGVETWLPPSINLGSPGFGWDNASICRDELNRYAVARTTTPTGFRVYNTTNSNTAPTNFERFRIDWSSNVALVGTQKGGTGTARAMALQTDAADRLVFDTTGSVRVATGLTVATLPASPTVGMIARVTDATAPAVGSTVAGGGSAAALVWHNGTNWIVIGV